MRLRWIVLIGVVLCCSFPLATTAADPIKFTPELTIPGLLDGTWTISSSSIAEYIRVIFIAFIWLVGTLATFMVIYGGVRWVAAAGNAGRINDARNIIDNAVIGLIIALSSIVLLNIINPNLTSFSSVNLPALEKKYQELLSVASAAVTTCTATTVTGTPDNVCRQGGLPNCSERGTLNAWVNASVRPENTSTWTNTAPDPFAVKAVIAKESLTSGVPLSRDTQVKNEDGSSASSAYGIGQFVAATLYQQLRTVERRLGGNVPDVCASAANGSISSECKTWLDQLTSPDSGPPTGMKAQVFMVSNYLGELTGAECVNGDVGKAAVAYYLGPGNVKYFCDPGLLSSASTKTQQFMQKQYPEAKKYLDGFTKFYNQYCTASGG